MNFLKTSFKRVLPNLLIKAQELGYSYSFTKAYNNKIGDVFKVEFITDLDVNEDSFFSTTKQCIYFDIDGYELAPMNGDEYEYNFIKINKRFDKELEIKKKRKDSLSKLTPEEIKLLGIENA